MAKSDITDSMLKECRDLVIDKHGSCKAWQIKDMIAEQTGTALNESTIRGRFTAMGEPLSSSKFKVDASGSTTERQSLSDMSKYKVHDSIPEELKAFIPPDEEFVNYIDRDIDKRLSIHYNCFQIKGAGYKYPISQGKQGTGKTFGHMRYAHMNGLPFFLYSCFEDFKLPKLFGDKTIKNGSIMFQESLFVKAIQSPSVILFDEINAVSNSNTFDFHALLQNRELYIKDANDGAGRVYKLHPECRIGFAQNPKSAKYIGGNIKASNFLGRCTFLTYPEFKKKEIKTAIMKRYPKMDTRDVDRFTSFYFAIVETIERSDLPVDISIRQLNNVVDLWLSGMSLQHSIEDGMSSMMEAVSQPKAKESFYRIAQAVWKELTEADKNEQI